MSLEVFLVLLQYLIFTAAVTWLYYIFINYADA